MVVKDQDNKEVECNIVARWKDGDNDFIAYTDGTKENDKLALFISKIENVNGIIKLFDIENDEEWKRATAFLDKNLFIDGDFDE